VRGRGRTQNGGADICRRQPSIIYLSARSCCLSKSIPTCYKPEALTFLAIFAVSLVSVLRIRFIIKRLIENFFIGLLKINRHESNAIADDDPLKSPEQAELDRGDIEL
jgi:hypothetical protein